MHTRQTAAKSNLPIHSLLNLYWTQTYSTNSQNAWEDRQEEVFANMNDLSKHFVSFHVKADLESVATLYEETMYTVWHAKLKQLVASSISPKTFSNITKMELFCNQLGLISHFSSKRVKYEDLLLFFLIYDSKVSFGLKLSECSDSNKTCNYKYVTLGSGKLNQAFFSML